MAPAEPAAQTPMLLADIGATNARFALENAQGGVHSIEVFKCADFAGIVDVLRAYLARISGPRPRHAAIAIANPIDGDHVKMTNRNWQFSIEETRRELGFDTLLLVNDFTALAMALPRLDSSQRLQIGGGEARPNAVIGLIGPGTGLGVSGLIPANDRWITLGSEGGHVSFSPMDETEVFILQFAWQEWQHVSAERLVSGPGIELIYRALASREGAQPPRDAAAIVNAAVADEDAFCVRVIDCFCGMLGTVASNVAMTLGAVGGIYIGGGIVPRLGQRFADFQFRRRFESKGRFEDYLAGISRGLGDSCLPSARLGSRQPVVGAHPQLSTDAQPRRAASCALFARPTTHGFKRSDCRHRPRRGGKPADGDSLLSHARLSRLA
jgi:glucokinase